MVFLHARSFASAFTSLIVVSCTTPYTNVQYCIFYHILNMYFPVQLCNMEYNLSEFRKNTKTAFDKALRSPVYIVRGGVVFTLVADVNLNPTGLVAAPAEVDEEEPGEDVKTTVAKIFTGSKAINSAPKPRKSKALRDELSDFLCPHGMSWVGCPNAKCKLVARNKGLL